MSDEERELPVPPEIVYVYCEDVGDIDPVRHQLASLPVYTYSPGGRLSFDALAPSLIVTGANVLVALISGLLSYANSKNGRTIHIKGSNGFEVTVPVGTSREELDRLIKLARECQPNRVLLASDSQQRPVPTEPIR
jgi:hypothetical protein